MTRPAAYDLFPGHEPVRYEGHHVVTHDHGIPSSFELLAPSDPNNTILGELERVLVGYRTNGNIHALYTVKDLVEHPLATYPNFKHHLLADVSERVARRITKQFLRKHPGKVGGIFDKRFDRVQKEEFIVTHKDDLILKIHNYPNLVLLHKYGEGVFDYDTITEIDGLFDYREGRMHNMVIMEAKQSKVRLDAATVADNITHMKKLFPQAEFSYVLFATRKMLYADERKLQPRHVHLYETLKKDGVATIFLSYNESSDQLRQIRDHLITQNGLLRKQAITVAGKTYISTDKIIIHDQSGNQLRVMEHLKDDIWREIPPKIQGTL